MYLVVSQWEALPGHEEEFETIGLEVGAVLGSLPGVEFLRSFQAESGRIVAVHGYTDEATYNKIVNNPESPFIKAIQEKQLESHGRWISSERGVTKQ